MPKTVVYPFGGGDLISALVAFPDATEITTISLELAGDPRRFKHADARRSSQATLGALRAEIGGLISVGSNTSENLSQRPAQRAARPGQLVPAGPRRGRLRAGRRCATSRSTTPATSSTSSRPTSTRSTLKRSIKERRRRARQSLKARLAVPELLARVLERRDPVPQDRRDRRCASHRHIGWNLGDDYLKKNPQLIRHLEKKGKVTVLVKGASYLLWRGDFSLIRGYMLDHLAWMLSDSTGIPPAYARRPGMVQETYGTYTGAFLEGAQTTRRHEAFVELWTKQKKRALPFRFGYVDMNKQAHLVVTKPQPKR